MQNNDVFQNALKLAYFRYKWGQDSSKINADNDIYCKYQKSCIF